MNITDTTNWEKIGQMAGQFGNTAMDFIGNSSNAIGTVLSGLFNSKEAQKNRDWQEQMSSTAHQREVADLRRAGLNPILSATGGSGASSPAGGQATMQPIDFSSGKQANIASRAQKSQESLNYKQGNNIDQDTSNKIITGGVLNEQILNTQANTAKVYQDIENSKTLTNAQALNLLYGSEAQKTSAAAAMKSSIASQTNAQASIINAKSTQQYNQRRASGRTTGVNAGVKGLFNFGYNQNR